MVRLAIAILSAIGAWSVWGVFTLPDSRFGVVFGVALTLRICAAVLVGWTAWHRLEDAGRRARD